LIAATTTFLTTKPAKLKINKKKKKKKKKEKKSVL
jgi:hypothetical protein